MHVRAYAHRVCCFLVAFVDVDAAVYCTRYECCCCRRCHVITMSPVGLSPTFFRLAISISLRYRYD